MRTGVRDSPLMATAATNWFPRPRHLGGAGARRLTSQFSMRKQDPAREVAHEQSSGNPGRVSGRAPVAAVLAVLGQHVGEQPEADSVDQQGQQRGHAVVDPGVVATRPDRRTARAARRSRRRSASRTAAVGALARVSSAGRRAPPGRGRRRRPRSSLPSSFCCSCEPRSISSTAKTAKPSATMTDATIATSGSAEPIAVTIGSRRAEPDPCRLALHAWLTPASGSWPSCASTRS